MGGPSIPASQSAEPAMPGPATGSTLAGRPSQPDVDEWTGGGEGWTMMGTRYRLPSSSLASRHPTGPFRLRGARPRWRPWAGSIRPVPGFASAISQPASQPASHPPTLVAQLRGGGGMMGGEAGGETEGPARTCRSHAMFHEAVGIHVYCAGPQACEAAFRAAPVLCIKSIRGLSQKRVYGAMRDAVARQGLSLPLLRSCCQRKVPNWVCTH